MLGLPPSLCKCRATFGRRPSARAPFPHSGNIAMHAEPRKLDASGRRAS